MHCLFSFCNLCITFFLFLDSFNTSSFQLSFSHTPYSTNDKMTSQKNRFVHLFFQSYYSLNPANYLGIYFSHFERSQRRRCRSLRVHNRFSITTKRARDKSWMRNRRKMYSLINDVIRGWSWANQTFFFFCFGAINHNCQYSFSRCWYDFMHFKIRWKSVRLRCLHSCDINEEHEYFVFICVGRWITKLNDEIIVWNDKWWISKKIYLSYLRCHVHRLFCVVNIWLSVCVCALVTTTEIFNHLKSPLFRYQFYRFSFVYDGETFFFSLFSASSFSLVLWNFIHCQR